MSPRHWLRSWLPTAPRTHARRPHPRLGVERLEVRTVPALTAMLIEDINVTAAFSNPTALTVVNGTLYFVATTPEAGTELWRSDGTPAGTALVADIRPGTTGSNPDFLTALGSAVYFAATDGVTGVELCRSDGTTTALVRDINPGPADANLFLLTAVGDALFFRATEPSTGSELWRSTGTTASLVKDINPGPAGGGPTMLFNLNGVLLFGASEPTAGRELYRSDGTADGTFLLRDINPGPASGLTGLTFTSPPETSAVVSGGLLYFKANDGVSGYELWASDGMPAGTALVKDINPGPAGSVDEFFLPGMTDVNGTLFFRANDGTNGVELWKSNGTAATTVLVKDINPGPASGFSVFEQPMVNVGGLLYFRADNGSAGIELWKSDGTAAGTVLVTDIFPGGGGSFPSSLTSVNGTLYFAASDPVYGRELWRVVDVVRLDVKPGEQPNSINLRSNGNTPVAVLTTRDFDARTIDTSNLSRLRFGDVRLTARVTPTRSKLEDVDGDGDLDLLLFFSTREIADRGALVADSTLAELTGFTRTGQAFVGTDSVQIVPPPGPTRKVTEGVKRFVPAEADSATGTVVPLSQPATGRPTASGRAAGNTNPQGIADPPLASDALISPAVVGWDWSTGVVAPTLDARPKSAPADEPPSQEQTTKDGRSVPVTRGLAFRPTASPVASGPRLSVSADWMWQDEFDFAPIDVSAPPVRSRMRF